MEYKIVPISDLRRVAGKVVHMVREGNEPIYITQHGRPTAVLLDYEKYEELVAELEALKKAQSAIRYPTVEQTNTFLKISELAEDMGVDDLAENHDHYLYGTDKK